MSKSGAKKQKKELSVTMDQDIRRERKKFSILLDHINQAIFMINAKAEIIEPVSEYTHEIFGRNIVGESIYTTLFHQLNPQDEVFSMVKSNLEIIFGEDMIQYDLVSHLFPKKMTIETQQKKNSKKILSIQYKPILDEKDEIQHLMFVIEEITHVEELNARIQREKIENERKIRIIQSLAKNSRKEIQKFFDDAFAHVKKIHKIYHYQTLSKDNEKTIYQILHTIKGNARIYFYTDLSHLIHSVETEVLASQHLLTSDRQAWNKTMDKCYQEIYESLGNYCIQAKKVFQVHTRIYKDIFETISELVFRIDEELFMFLYFSDFYDEKKAHSKMKLSIQDQEILHKERIKDLFILFHHQANSTGLTDIAINCGKIVDLCEEFTANPQNIDFNRFKPLFHRYKKSIKNLLIEINFEPKINLNALLWQEIIKEIVEISSYGNCQQEIRFKDNDYKNLIDLTIKSNLFYFRPILFTLKKIEAQNFSEKNNMKHQLFQLLWNYIAFLSRVFHNEEGDFKAYKIFLQLNAQELQEMRKRSRDLNCFSMAILNLKKIYKLKSGINHYELLEKIAENYLGSRDILKIFIGKNQENLNLQELKKQSLEDMNLDFRYPVIDSWQRKTPSLYKNFMEIIHPQHRLSSLSLEINYDLTSLLNTITSHSFIAENNKVETIEILKSKFTQFEQAFRAYTGKEPAVPCKLLTTFRHLYHVPVKPIFQKMRAMVYEIADRSRKEVDLKIKGDDIAIDRSKISLLSDCMTHIIGNAVDHGIETIDERKAAEKEAVALIEIDCKNFEDGIQIVIQDNGRGMDAEKICEKALAKNLITAEEMNHWSEDEKLNLIFISGLSTKDAVSDISGRGVGMDVVKTNLDSIAGSVVIKTKLGQGTSFIIFIQDESDHNGTPS